VAIVSFVSALSDYRKEKQFLKQHLQEEETMIVEVLRDGVIKEIHRNFICVGDIIKIKSGMNIPVDGIVIEGNGI
jgi:P-type E1-E2 ATPase